MIFSKSFGYKLREIFNIAVSEDAKLKIQVEEIAAQLALPIHFLGKVLKKLATQGILNSAKGPYGGFSINDQTLITPLVRLIEIFWETERMDICVLRFRKFNSKNPIPFIPRQKYLRNSGTNY